MLFRLPSTVCIRKKRQSEIFNEEEMNCDESQKDDSTDSDLPTTLETLGNHLHAQISSYFPHLYKETVSKVTGVLLECGQQDVLAMLQDFQLLQKRVARVLPLIIPQSSANTTEQAKNKNIPASSEDSILSDWTDSASEELFDKVAAIDPIFCAKITGMLLDKKPSFLKQCLTDASLLNSAIEKARTTYLKSLEMTSVSSLLENKDGEEEESEGGGHSSTGVLNNRLNDLGNIVFSHVVLWYPKLADKITGMLLEMNIEELESVINNSDLLKSRADKAYLVLKNSGYLTADDQIKEQFSMAFR